MCSVERRGGLSFGLSFEHLFVSCMVGISEGERESAEEEEVIARETTCKMITETRNMSETE